jgi:hypothetical protein
LIADPSNERGLRDPELEGDLLKFIVGERVLEQDNDGGVPTLPLTDERVDPPQSMPEGHVDGFHP